MTRRGRSRNRLLDDVPAGLYCGCSISEELPMPYKNILVAVDLTEEAQEVLNRAREVAQQNGAELSVIVVVKPINQVYSGFDVAALSADAALIEVDAVRQAESRLAEHAQALN